MRGGMVSLVITRALVLIRDDGLIASLREHELNRKANRPFGTDFIRLLDVIKTLQQSVNGLLADAKYAPEAADERYRPGVVAVRLPLAFEDFPKLIFCVNGQRGLKNFPF